MLMHRIARLALGALALSLGATAPAAAEVTAFPVERFRPTLDRDGLIDVESGSVGEHLTWDAGLWLNYALNPLILHQNGERVQSLVQHRIGGDLTASVGLFRWVRLGIDVPFI